MSFGRRIFPDHFLPPDWDDAWALGWFRMRQSLFTTHFLEFERQFYPAVWLRVGLAGLVPDRKFLELKKLNRQFRIEFRPSDPQGPSVTQETLYTKYRQALPFEPAPTLRDLLAGESARSLFPTWEVNLYDGGKLIAGGFLDMGAQASAGIVSFYDPDYKKHSLGKYLIYLKMEWSQGRGLNWFYPGYAAPGQPRFDYKWALGTPTLEYLELATGLWRRRNPEDPVPNPLADMVTRLEDLGPIGVLYRYLHLDINLNPQVSGMELFDFPIFIDVMPDRKEPGKILVVHDPRDDQYHLLLCQSVYRFSGTASRESIFESDLLQIRQDLVATSDPRELALALGLVMAPG